MYKRKTAGACQAGEEMEDVKGTARRLRMKESIHSLAGQTAKA